MELVQSQLIPINKIEVNNGQLGDVAGLPKNPRIIRDEKYKKLKKSIEDDPEMLSLREVLVYPCNDKFVIIGGNMRFRAQKELGFKDIICKVIPHTFPKERLGAIVIKDNVGFGEWDFEALANEWEASDLDDWAIDMPEFSTNEEEEGEAQEDDFNVDDNMPKNPTSKLGDIYQLGNHRLICGDSTKKEFLEALMDGGVADMVVTDPPYNVNYQGGTKDALKIQNDSMSDANFLAFLTDAFSSTDNVLKKGGAFYIWHADSEGFNFRMAAKQTGWQIRECLIWNKNSLVLGRQDYQWKHEPCLYGWKDGAAHYFIDNRSLTTIIEEKPDFEKMNKEELKQYLQQYLEIPTSVIDENKPLRNGEHPTMKPVKLIARQIKNSSRFGDSILDPFGGSGTTLIASEQLGRSCRMVEFDPIYVDVIIKRWEELTGKTAKFIKNILENSKTESDN